MVMHLIMEIEKGFLFSRDSIHDEVWSYATIDLSKTEKIHVLKRRRIRNIYISLIVYISLFLYLYYEI